MKRRIISIIPARGGSKGLPRKNIYPINGKPMVAYTIEASLKSSYISKTVVSSEDDEILSVSSKWGAETIKRPSELAQDDSSSEAVIHHCIKLLEVKGEHYDIIILLQPTSPLRNVEDIDSAFALYFEKNATSLISVYEPAHSPLKAFKLDQDGFLEGLVNNEYPFLPRQALPKTFYPNGAIYIIEEKEFIKSCSLFSEKTLPFIMPIEKSIDIDTIADIQGLSI